MHDPKCCLPLTSLLYNNSCLSQPVADTKLENLESQLSNLGLENKVVKICEVRWFCNCH